MQDVMEVSPYIQKQRALYLEKNAWLDAHYERIEPHAFYREIFPVGSFEREGHWEDAKGNGIGITVTDKRNVADGAEKRLRTARKRYWNDGSAKRKGQTLCYQRWA